MTLSFMTVLILLALVAFILAAIGLTWRKTDLIAVGLALWALSQFIGSLSSLNVKLLLLILAFLAFVAAAVGWRYRKINLIAIGLALWMLSLLI